MNWNTRFHNAARAALATIALTLLTGGFSPSPQPRMPLRPG